MHASVDFGYLWPWTHGHLLISLAALMFLLLARMRRWPGPMRAAAGLVLVWSLAAFCVVQYVIGIDRRLALPTPTFLPSGAGKVLDMGAGSGRSTLMVLESRPQSTVVALDSFSEEYVRHFGQVRADEQVSAVGAQRLLSNLRAAGVAERASIQPGDMRALPLGAASFDAVVSTYAIDHLRSADRETALREAARVLKPGGEFLLMVMTKDFWMTFAYGPVFMHHRGPSQADWAASLTRAGFEVREQGTKPASLYFLARKP